MTERQIKVSPNMRVNVTLVLLAGLLVSVWRIAFILGASLSDWEAWRKETDVQVHSHDRRIATIEAHDVVIEVPPNAAR